MKDKWILALQLQTAEELRTLTEVIMGEKFADDSIKHLRGKLENEED